MTEDRRKLCLNCAWRADGVKRFSMDGGGTLHCPDYTEDVTLCNVKAGPGDPEIKKD